MTSSGDGLIPNPWLYDLEQALVEVKKQSALSEDALDTPLRQMTDQAIWIGPVARRFTEDLGVRRPWIRQATQAIVNALEDTIKPLPPNVSPSSISFPFNI